MIESTTRDPITHQSVPLDGKTLDRILLAVDGSAASDLAVQAVAALIKGRDADVFVVNVTDEGRLAGSTSGPDTTTLRWTTPSAAQARVDTAVDTLQSLGVRATGTVYNQIEGFGHELVDISRSLRCGLIALGSGGGGLLGAVLLGSVARHVLHRADRSVMVAPLGCSVSSTFTRILVAVDGSSQSERAVELAGEAAEVAGVEVVVLHVSDPHAAPWIRYESNGISDELDTPQTAASLVDRMAGAVSARGLSAVPTVRALTGHVAADILKAAVSYDCQLLVVGAHGRGRSLTLGGVASQLLRNATVPVLVAR